MTKANSDSFICEDCGEEFGFESVLRKHSYSCSKVRDRSTPKRNDGSTVILSPLTEYCEGLRSVKKAIEYLDPKIANAGSHRPQAQYYKLISSILSDEGVPKIDTHRYEQQHAERVNHSASDYRDKYGNGDWVMDYQCIDVAPIKPEIQSLLSDHSTPDAKHLVVPITPNTELPLPVLVSSRERLQDAISMLTDLPLKPAASADEVNSVERFPVEKIYQKIASRKDINRVRVDGESIKRPYDSTATAAAYKNDFRRFALIHTGSASTVAETIVVAFGVEFPSGAAVVEWLDHKSNNTNTTQNGLAIKPGPEGIKDLREVDLQSEYAEIVYIDH